MPTDVILPQWGMGMDDGKVIRWLKQEGEAVNQGEPLVEIESAKIDSELESPASGLLARVVVPEGQVVKVGALLAVIAAPGEELPLPEPPPTDATPAPAAPTSVPTVAPAPARQSGPQAQVVPAARRLAQAHGIDLGLVEGTGPGGRVLVADIEELIQAESLPGTQEVPLTGMRKTIADRMLGSVQTKAQVTLTTEIDVTESGRLREELVSRWRERRVRPVPLALLVKAVSRALTEHPHMNATITGDTVRLLKEINVGFAVSVEEGLLVPVVRGANEKSLLDINRDVVELARKAQGDELSRDDLGGATFTITTLGPYDVDAFTPIIDPPQVAILGTGRVVEKPVVHEGEIAKRAMMYLSLTFDHRATDGVPAALFLQAVKRHLEEPRWMVVE
jgi:pyruvate dehydrogenase E2 component (dihydrolipoamide acetyltransferase)